MHFTFEYMVSFVKVLLKSRARLCELIVRKVQRSETFNSVIKALLQTNPQTLLEHAVIRILH